MFDRFWGIYSGERSWFKREELACVKAQKVLDACEHQKVAGEGVESISKVEEWQLNYERSEAGLEKK